MAASEEHSSKFGQFCTECQRRNGQLEEDGPSMERTSYSKYLEELRKTNSALLKPSDKDDRLEKQTRLNSKLRVELNKVKTALDSCRRQLELAEATAERRADEIAAMEQSRAKAVQGHRSAMSKLDTLSIGFEDRVAQQVHEATKAMEAQHREQLADMRAECDAQVKRHIAAAKKTMRAGFDKDEESWKTDVIRAHANERASWEAESKLLRVRLRDAEASNQSIVEDAERLLAERTHELVQSEMEELTELRERVAMVEAERDDALERLASSTVALEDTTFHLNEVSANLEDLEKSNAEARELDENERVAMEDEMTNIRFAYDGALEKLMVKLQATEARADEFENQYHDLLSQCNTVGTDGVDGCAGCAQLRKERDDARSQTSELLLIVSADVHAMKLIEQHEMDNEESHMEVMKLHYDHVLRSKEHKIHKFKEVLQTSGANVPDTTDGTTEGTYEQSYDDDGGDSSEDEFSGPTSPQ